MTGKNFIHELPESSILIEQIARSKQTRAQLAEKDYWLMHSLWGLQQQEYKFELKAGDLGPKIEYFRGSRPEAGNGNYTLGDQKCALRRGVFQLEKRTGVRDILQDGFM